MKRREFLAVLPSSVVAAQLLAEESTTPEKITVGANDWPWWRGPNRNGIAPAQKIPLEWSATKNILWKAEPEKESQGVLCLDRASGKPLWHKEVHRGDFVKGGNTKASHASSTPACDGKKVFINFLNNGAVYTTALDLEGNRLWQ